MFNSLFWALYSVMATLQCGHSVSKKTKSVFLPGVTFFLVTSEPLSILANRKSGKDLTWLKTKDELKSRHKKIKMRILLICAAVYSFFCWKRHQLAHKGHFHLLLLFVQRMLDNYCLCITMGFTKKYCVKKTRYINFFLRNC